MKTWYTPELQELDIRMTLNGVIPSYSEDKEGYAAYCDDNNIQIGTSIDYASFLKIYSGQQS